MVVPTTSAVAEFANEIGVPETVMGAAPGISRSLPTMYWPAELVVYVEPAIVKTGAGPGAWVLIGGGTRAWVLPAMMTV